MRCLQSIFEAWWVPISRPGLSYTCPSPSGAKACGLNGAGRGCRFRTSRFPAIRSEAHDHTDQTATRPDDRDRGDTEDTPTTRKTHRPHRPDRPHDQTTATEATRKTHRPHERHTDHTDHTARPARRETPATRPRRPRGPRTIAEGMAELPL